MSGVNSQSSSPAISVQGLTKTFGHNQALRGVDLEVSRGDSLVIFGPNGAGKSTLIRILATIMNPTSGSLSYNGHDLKDDAEAIRRQIGLVPHQTLLYNNLSAWENLEFYGRMYDVPDLKNRIARVAEMMGVASRLRDRVGTLSRGLQQRVSVARAVIHRPSILLLDEPETGLDPDALTYVWSALKSEDDQKRTLIFTTHNLDMGLQNCLNLIILSGGKIAHLGPGSELDLPGLKEKYRLCTQVKA